MTMFSVDVESDGPVPGLYSMLSVALVPVREDDDSFFYRELQPISDQFVPEALEVSGLDRDRLKVEGTPPEVFTQECREWVMDNNKGRPVFISDNPGFDFAFVNYYFHAFSHETKLLDNGDGTFTYVSYNIKNPNPFGWSSRRIGDLYCGMEMDTFAKWKHLRQTAHTHHAVDDARGNAEALLAMKKMGLKISTK